MAKVTAPLMGFAASGAIAKSIVYGSWKGIKYARQHIIPANPRSTEQTDTRSVFTFASRVWQVAPADFRAAYQQAVKGNPLTDRNKFMGDNIAILRPLTTLVGMEMSPGAAGGLPVPVTVTGGVGTVTVTAAAPAVLPSGWTVVRFIAAAIHEQDPHVGTSYDIEVGADTTSAYSVALTGLAAGNYVATGWFEYQRSALASDLAYGAAFAEAVTVT